MLIFLHGSNPSVFLEKTKFSRCSSLKQLQDNVISEATLIGARRVAAMVGLAASRQCNKFNIRDFSVGQAAVGQVWDLYLKCGQAIKIIKYKQKKEV